MFYYIELLNWNNRAKGIAKHPCLNCFSIRKTFIFNSLLIFNLMLFSTPLQAGQVLKAFVGQQDEHFLINLVMQIDAPKDKVYRLFTDYSQLEQLSDSIQSSQILKSTELTASAGVIQVKLVSEGCVLFFCQTITQVQNVYELDNGYIHINVEPSLSNLKLNNQLWHIEATGKNQTRIHYSADIVPDFWIPPIIGDWIFQNKLLEEATHLINNTEKMANMEKSLPLIPQEQVRYTQETDIQNPKIQNNTTAKHRLIEKE